jgi:hypothetical protein
MQKGKVLVLSVPPFVVLARADRMIHLRCNNWCWRSVAAVIIVILGAVA